MPFNDHQQANSIALVHAFADVPYHRSSFHFAGSSHHIAKFITEFAECTYQELLPLDSKQCLKFKSIDNNYDAKCRIEKERFKNTEHPTVGLIDHISVMPLPLNSVICSGSNTSADELAAISSAHHIGSAIQSNSFPTKSKIKVHYYGLADSQYGMSLAQVRNSRTNFFNQMLSKENCHSEMVCIGCPHEYTENFNVRLSFPSKFSRQEAKKIASSLTKKLREKNGGLPGVEALTLNYDSHSDNDKKTLMFECACNLLQPKVSTVDDILDTAQEWLHEVDSKYEVTIDNAYRVGTTSSKCIDVLNLNNEKLRDHYEKLFEDFRCFID